MFDSQVLSAVATGVRSGRYNLLLGAGISLDSLNSEGQALPNSGDFRRELCALKNVSPFSSLQRVYDTLDADEIDRLVVRRFRVETVGATARLIPLFLWRRIFTLNIDDAVELSYKQFHELQGVTDYNFTDIYSEPEDRNTAPLVHLHGCVTRAADGFVFSRTEYARHMAKPNPWMTVLAQFMPNEPFIVMGSSLDEIDIEYYLAQRDPARVRGDIAPSVLVEPFPDAATLRDCEKYSLTLFEGTAIDFLSVLEGAIPDRPSRHALLPRSLRDLLPQSIDRRMVAALAADFEVVPLRPRGEADAYRFLYGHPPSWPDVAAGVDISRRFTRHAMADIALKLKQEMPSPLLLLLLEVTGTGKSTTLRRVAYELSIDGINVLYASPVGRLEPQSTAELLDLIDGPLVVIVDNLAEHSGQIAGIISRMDKRDVVFLCGERSYRWPHIERSVSKVEYLVWTGLNSTPGEMEALIDVCAAQGLVGDERASHSKKRFARQIASDPIAVATCRILNDFKPLDHIVSSLIAETDAQDLKRFLTVSLSYFCVRSGIAVELLSTVAGVHGWDAQFGLNHPMPLAYLDANKTDYITPASVTLSERILGRVSENSPDTMLDIFVNLGEALAPRVTRETIYQRTPEARLAGRLFDYDQIVRPFLGELAEDLYRQVRDSWRWNSRYWEQVALLTLQKAYDAATESAARTLLWKATQHARHAVNIEAHPQPLTTLGKILLAQLGSRDQRNDRAYSQAFGFLSRAISEERRRRRINIQPFLTLFRGTANFIDLGGSLSSSQISGLRSFISVARDKLWFHEEIREPITNLEVLLSAGRGQSVRPST